MRSLLRRTALCSTAAVPPAVRGVAVSGLALALVAVAAMADPVGAQAGVRRSVPHITATSARAAASFGQIILPDLLVVAPHGLSPARITAIRKLAGAGHVIAFDGGEIKAAGRPVSVIGVSPAQFRSWTPLRTASDQRFWTALSDGKFVASTAAAGQLKLRRGASYPLAGASTRRLSYGRAAALGVAGVDLLVNTATSRELGLVHQVAALISAPGASMATLTAAVRRVAGKSAKIVDLRRQRAAAASPAPPSSTPAAGAGQLPASYLQLFQESAARYCKALPWTVLAAIGQIESADGTNVGPSSAGALGPMQFLPSTWQEWGISGFGRSGPPDILNPYDAVPSAARMLCADGASRGASGLRQAIFAYNHADWYVNEVLGLAAEYAKDYR
ncbi:MAG: lytic transglycosylase domain-containing protein [Actinomycetota bacterium]